MMFYTIREAATEWVYGFNAVPTAVVEKLMRLDPDDVREITPGRRDEDADYHVSRQATLELTANPNGGRAFNRRQP